MFTEIALVCAAAYVAYEAYEKKKELKQSEEESRVRDEIERLHYQIMDSFTPSEVGDIKKQIGGLFKSIKYPRTHKNCTISMILLDQLFRNHESFILNRREEANVCG